MVDEKDKQIERLFDDYASSLKPNERLADSALRKMRDKKSKPKKSRAPVWIGAVATCAAVAVVVFSVMSFFGNKGDGGLGANSSPSAPDASHRPENPSDTNAPPAIDAPNNKQSYSITDVRETSVNVSFAQNYIDTTGLSDAQIVSENYYAYYLKATDEFVYFKAELDISYNGGNIQMSIIAENSAFSGREFAEQYYSVIQGSEYSHSTENNNGEYVTKAHCEQGGYNYYVSATADISGAERIAADLIGVENE